MNIILQLLIHHPDIHYYQGLHDIVLTFVLTVGDTLAYAIMDVLVEYHLRYAFYSNRFSLLHKGTVYRDFLDANMTRTRMYIAFLKPLLSLLDPPLEEFITRYDRWLYVVSCEPYNYIIGHSATISSASAG